MTHVQVRIHAACTATFVTLCIWLSKQEAESRSASAPGQEIVTASTGASGIADHELAAAEQNEAQHSSRTDELHADSTFSQKPLA